MVIKQISQLQIMYDQLYSFELFMNNKNTFFTYYLYNSLLYCWLGQKA